MDSVHQLDWDASKTLIQDSSIDLSQPQSHSTLVEGRACRFASHVATFTNQSAGPIAASLKLIPARGGEWGGMNSA